MINTKDQTLKNKSFLSISSKLTEEMLILQQDEQKRRNSVFSNSSLTLINRLNAAKARRASIVSTINVTRIDTKIEEIEEEEKEKKAKDKKLVLVPEKKESNFTLANNSLKKRQNDSPKTPKKQDSKILNGSSFSNNFTMKTKLMTDKKATSELRVSNFSHNDVPKRLSNNDIFDDKSQGQKL